MLWSVLLAVAVILVWVGRSLSSSEEVHGIAATATGILSFLWGLVWAPPTVQLLVGGVLLGLHRFVALRM